MLRLSTAGRASAGLSQLNFSSIGAARIPVASFLLQPLTAPLSTLPFMRASACRDPLRPAVQAVPLLSSCSFSTGAGTAPADGGPSLSGKGEAGATESAGTPSWTSLGIKSHVLGKLQTQLNISRPSPVQVEAIPLLSPLEKEGHMLPPPRDLLLHAETGSGKTLAYLLPIFSMLDPRTVRHAGLRAIIVCPTRELSHQVQTVAEKLAKVGNKKGETRPAVRVMRAVGELNGSLLQELRSSPPHILIATPASLARLLPQHLNLGELAYVVLDEADELARNYHVASARHILSHAVTGLKHRPCCVAVTATPSSGLTKLLKGYLRSGSTTLGKVDLLGPGGLSMPSTLDHYIVKHSSAAQAVNSLTRFLAACKPQAALVFHNSQASLEAAEVYLRSKGASVSVLGNAYANKQRNAALEAVSAGKSVVLLATEMAARGLDLPRLSHVINMDPPASAREYVHRAGRAGRLSSTTPDRRGSVLSWCSGEEDLQQLLSIGQELGVPVMEAEFREGKMVTSGLLLEGGAGGAAAAGGAAGGKAAARKRRKAVFGREGESKARAALEEAVKMKVKAEGEAGAGEDEAAAVEKEEQEQDQENASKKQAAYASTASADSTMAAMPSSLPMRKRAASRKLQEPASTAERAADGAVDATATVAHAEEKEGQKEGEDSAESAGASASQAPPRGRRTARSSSSSSSSRGRARSSAGGEKVEAASSRGEEGKAEA